MESYHIPRGPKRGIYFADQAGLEQFLAVAKHDKELAPHIPGWMAALALGGSGIGLTPVVGPANMPFHVATEDDLTILRSGVAALIDCWNYGVESPEAAARAGDIDRLREAMFRRQARADKKMKWKA